MKMPPKQKSEKDKEDGLKAPADKGKDVPTKIKVTPADGLGVANDLAILPDLYEGDDEEN